MRRLNSPLAGMLLLGELWPARGHLGPRQTAPITGAFDWYALSPGDEIRWTSCFEKFLCARLNLPLDYSTPNGPTIQIALQMLPAADRDHYQGTIIVNPGGPGDSGTQFVLGDGAKLADVFGPTFDILGFDPRGTGASTPLAQCFDTPQQADLWSATDPLVLRLDDDSVPFARAHDMLLGALCADKLGGTGKEQIGANATEWGIGRFMDTATVATDMLRIVEKLGQERLQYFGISYGTMLGQYFAALYPDKIHRMIIDGVIDGDRWLSGMIYEDIMDTGLVIDAFYSYCFGAGREGCPIWEATRHAIDWRMNRVLDALQRAPIAIPRSASGPAVMTEDAFLAQVFAALYVPSTGFPTIALLTRAVETRNQSYLSELSFYPSSALLPPWMQPNQAVFAVSCTDFSPLSDSLAEELATVRIAASLTPRLGRYAASLYSRIRITCANWPVRAKKRYNGPLAGGPSDVPVLVLSTRYDPVTPLASARNVTARYPGMRLLVQNTSGHTAFLSLSNCTADVMRAYMTDGSLPPEGATCD